MANDRKVIGITLTAEGAEEVEAAFKSLGTEGEAAAKRIKTALENIDLKSNVGDEVKRQLSELGPAGEEAAAKINAALARVGIGDGVIARVARLKTTFAELKQSFSGTQAGFAQIGKGISDAVTGFERGAKAITVAAAAIGGAVGAVGLLAKGAADNAEAIQNQADAFGLSFEQMQKLQNAISAVGGDQGLLERALTKFTTGIDGVGESAEESGKKVGKFAGISKTGIDGLLQYSAKLRTLGDTQAQLAQVVNDFGAKGASTLLAFLRSVSDEFDAAQQAANKMLPALDRLGQANLADLDQAGDRLATNFSRLQLLVGSRVAPAFTSLYDVIREIIGTVGPALADAFGGVAQAIADKVTANKDAILAFAKEITVSIIGLARDIREALNGVNSGDTSNWIITLKDDVTGAFTFIRGAVTGVLIPAFNAISTALEPVAKAINAVFGTQLSGRSLAIAGVLAQLAGAFRVVGGAANIAVGGLRVFFSLLINGRANVQALIGVVTQLGGLVRATALGLAAFLAANPEIALLVIAVAAAAAGIAYLATRQTEAAKAADAQKDALRQLDAAHDAVVAGIDGSAESYEALKTRLLEDGRAALTNAEAHVVAAKTVVDTLQAQRDAAIEANGAVDRFTQNNLDAAKRSLTIAQDGLKAWSDEIKTVRDRITQLEDPTRQAAEANRDLANSYNQAAGAAQKLEKLQEGFARINVSGPGGVLKTKDVPIEGFQQAANQSSAFDAATRQAEAALTKLNAAKTQFVQSVETIKTVIGGIQVAITDAFIGISASAQVAFGDIPKSVAGAFKALAQSASLVSQAWTDAIGAIETNAKTMVDAIGAMIAGLESKLGSLRTAVSDAKNAAENGGSGFARGGMIYGPGGPTSDNIPVWVSPGEFIVRAAAVEKLGPAFLRLLNSGRYGLEELLRQFSGLRFATGGLVPSVSMPSMSFAPAGAASWPPVSGSNLTLVLENDTRIDVGFVTDEVVSRINQAVASRRMTSAGRRSPYER